MFNSFRRGPATLRIFRAIQPSSRISKSPLTTRLTATRPLKVARSFHATSRWQRPQEAQATLQDHGVNGEGPISSEPKITEFQQLADHGLLSKKIVATITQGMKLTTLTPVQSLTITQTLKGTDVLAQAKTGTGKTIGFLLPLLHNILRDHPELISLQARKDASSADVIGLIISPTRELAEQIAQEARRLTHGTGIVVQSAVGGTQKSSSLRQMQRFGCHLLVGTPGRLKDILSDRSSGVSAPNLNTFVLDEADRLMDQGFWPEIQQIQDLLPDPDKVDRQTMMFSATMNREVLELVRSIMKPDFEFVKTVRDGEQQTHERVPQHLVHVAGFENLLPTLLELCKREIAARKDGPAPFKAIVYFSATAMVSIAAKAFSNLRSSSTATEANPSSRPTTPLSPARIVEIHARLSQGQRTKAADIFRSARCGIMFSSDVTARGMDFPNVTHVIQVGCPKQKDDYIHRIGRTARGDKEGQGWLLVPTVEKREIRNKLSDLPLKQDESLQAANVDMTQPAQLPAQVATILSEIGEALQQVDEDSKNAAFLAYLGVYSMLPKQTLVDSMNQLAKYGWGMEEPPSIPSGLAQRLGLSRLSGVRVASSSFRGGDRGQGRGGSQRYPSRGGGGGGGYGNREGRNFDRSDSERGGSGYDRSEGSFSGRQRSFGSREQRPRAD